MEIIQMIYFSRKQILIKRPIYFIYLIKIFFKAIQ